MNGWLQYRVCAHPGPQTQDELGSLSVVHQARHGLGHREHKLLQVLVVEHIFVLGQLPHGCRQKLQWGHQQAKRGERQPCI